MKKRIISISILAIVIIGLIAYGIVSSKDNINRERYNELVDCGLSNREAKQLAKIEGIIAKLENAGLKIVDVDSIFRVVDESGKIVKETIGDITTSDINYITKTLQDYSLLSHMSYEKMLQDIATKIQEKPDDTTYRITYESGAWIEVEIVQECVEKTNEVQNKSSVIIRPLNATYPNEVEIYNSEESVDGIGTYKYTCKFKIFNGVYYAQCYLTQMVAFSEDFQCVEIKGMQSGQAAGGIISITNARANTNINSVSYNIQPEMWCEVENQVVYKVSDVIAVELADPFSTSPIVGNNWTQYAIIRTSLGGIHAYGAYYTVHDSVVNRHK